MLRRKFEFIGGQHHLDESALTSTRNGAPPFLLLMAVNRWEPQLAPLLLKAERLAGLAWPRNLREPDIRLWLQNFDPYRDARARVRMHCLYVLTHCVAFRDDEFRTLLGAMYRELFERPLVVQARRAGGSRNVPARVRDAVRAALDQTRFVGLGGSHKSGAHIIPIFKKAAHLADHQVLATTDLILNGAANDPASTLRDPTVRRYVVIDDVCGTGDSGDALRPLIERMRELAVKAGFEIRVDAHFLVGTTKGIQRLRRRGPYDGAQALIVCGTDYAAFSPSSRIFQQQKLVMDGNVQRVYARRLFKWAGRRIEPQFPLGFGGCQLLIAFGYNTPDNTLPALWGNGTNDEWIPIFPRYE